MESQFINPLLAGIGVLITSVGGLVFGMWKWDSRRIRADAEADIRRANERAKERQHELEMAKLAVQKEAREREADLLGRLETHKQEIIDIRKMVEERLFTALDEARQAKNSLADVISDHIEAIDKANEAEMAAIEALRGDVGGLRDKLSGEYQSILTRLGDVLDHSVSLNRMVGDLVTCVASYHEQVETFVSQSSGDRCGDDPESKSDQTAHEEKEENEQHHNRT